MTHKKNAVYILFQTTKMAVADVECSLELVIAAVLNHTRSEFDSRKGRKSATKAEKGYSLITETAKLIHICGTTP